LSNIQAESWFHVEHSASCLSKRR